MLLASAATLPLLLATAGCRSSDAFAGPDPLAGRPPLPHDVLTLQAVIAAEVTAQLLRSLLAQHQDHLAQLKARLVEPSGTSPSSPTPSGRVASPSAGA